MQVCTSVVSATFSVHGLQFIRVSVHDYLGARLQAVISSGKSICESLYVRFINYLDLK